jgi:mannose-6-phosphate isomerase
MMRDLLRFRPIYQERVWGGRLLETSLGRELPGRRPIGESWEIVDRGPIQSVVRVGPHEGQPLRSLIERHAARLMGPAWDPQRPFPILVKWLDCRERLSLQVHPPAGEGDLEPKSECWLVAETSPGAHLIAGFRPGVTRARFEAALRDGTVEQCLHRFPVAAGDSLYVPSGRLHAIDAGNLILEIQENSDTTYRVHDWGRTGLDGKPRPLHVEEALRSILWDDFAPEPVRAAPTSAVLADCPQFLVRRVVLGKGERLSLAAGEQPRLVGVVSGRVHSGGDTIARGENVIVPYAAACNLLAPDMAILLVTENFAMG